ncbi:MAG TPA: GspH/FimT family pseudopilin [Acidobacteriota bacterium]|nr:GspH/FimT family pseudopilin [Acidobacteriota bacterium]
MPTKGEFPTLERTRPGTSGGFSTTELLMVVALAATVLALSVPQIRQSLSSYRLSSTAERLSAELSMGRMLAISRNAIFEIQTDQEQGSIQIIDPDDPENPPRIPKTLEPGITFTQVPGTAVRFFSRGHARPGTFVIQDEFGNSISIEVNESGLIQVSGFQEQ